jgi:hypothetical protein
VSSSLNFQACHACEQAIRSHAKYCTICHFVLLCSLYRSKHHPFCLSLSFLFVFILPFFCSFQPSPGVGNNRDFDATLNLLRRQGPRPAVRLARSLDSRLDFPPPPQHEAQTRNHLGYFLYTSARADQGGRSCMHVPLLTLIACRLPSQGKKMSDVGLL